MAVVYIFEIMPIEQMDCVITPHSAPGPVTRIQHSAQMMLGIVRMASTSARTMNASHFGTTFSAHRNATGMARMPPKIVPSSAMAMVCIIRYGTLSLPRDRM